MQRKVTGKDLLDWGLQPGPHFSGMLKVANQAVAQGRDPRAAITELLPRELRLKSEGGPFHVNVHAGGDPEERANLDSVIETMRALMRVPTIKAGAVMPDACPAGTIPVGGVVAAENAIHPGFHSADICCSVAMAILGDLSPKAVLDRAMEVTHFGPGARPENSRFSPSADTIHRFQENRYLRSFTEPMTAHFATQGDGNHFLYVGTLRSTGQTVVVTHHGSRRPGAMLYKAGMKAAERFRQKLSPETPKGAAWIPADTKEGQAYWEALQTIRAWTRENHFKIHEILGFRIEDWLWNEHNFVFQRDDGLFYHAKGATPGWGLGLVPLNMAEPILITRGTDAKHGLGFLPHGAGRHHSRSRFLRSLATRDRHAFLAEQTAGIDARFFCGDPDYSELPGAYKSAATVRAQIDHYGLAEIVDEITPYGSIMAGNWRAQYQGDGPDVRKR